MHLEKYDFYRVKKSSYQIFKSQYQALGYESKRASSDQKILDSIGASMVFYSSHGELVLGFDIDKEFDFPYTVLHSTSKYKVIRPHRSKGKVAKEFNNQMIEAKKLLNENVKNLPDFERFLAGQIGLDIDYQSFELLSSAAIGRFKSGIVDLREFALVKKLKASKNDLLSFDFLEHITAGQYIDLINDYNSKIKSKQ